MPGLDHKGPEGQGPRTGRAMGNCKAPAGDGSAATETTPTDQQFAGRGTGRRPGRAGGRGRGLGNGTGRGLGRGAGRGAGRRNN